MTAYMQLNAMHRQIEVQLCSAMCVQTHLIVMWVGNLPSTLAPGVSGLRWNLLCAIFSAYMGYSCPGNVLSMNCNIVSLQTTHLTVGTTGCL